MNRWLDSLSSIKPGSTAKHGISPKKSLHGRKFSRVIEPSQPFSGDRPGSLPPMPDRLEADE